MKTIKTLFRTQKSDVALCLALLLIARLSQENGHGWGDDFALYINQARGLTDGTLWNVVRDNRYALDNSAWNYFSPTAYPWGLPLLLAPIVAVWGINFSLLKLVPTLGYIAATMATLNIARHRFGPLTATATTVVVALNPWFISATGAVLSDLVFLGFALTAVVFLDHSVEKRDVFTPGRNALIITAVLIALAFHVRRDALGLIPAIAATQLMMVRSGDRPSRRDIARPWYWILGLTIGIHLVLPAPILATSAPGGGLSALRHHIIWYREPFAELVGLKEIGDQPIRALGSNLLGDIIFWLIIGGLVVALAVAAVEFLRREISTRIPIATAFAGISMLVLLAPYHYQRYIYTSTILGLILAVDGLRTLLKVLKWPRLGLIAAGCIIAIPAAQHTVTTKQSLGYHITYSYTLWGPESPVALELFEAVVDNTDERDVIVYTQARTMNLYTRRRAIQGNNLEMLMSRGDWFAQDRIEDYIQTPMTIEEAQALGLRAVWSNDRFILWKIPEPNFEEIAP